MYLGMTALDWALRYGGNNEIAEVIREYGEN